jgi:hypothetical protein
MDDKESSESQNVVSRLVSVREIEITQEVSERSSLDVNQKTSNKKRN